MTTRNLLFTTVLFLACLQAIGQHFGFAFQEAKNKGISIEHLDSLYKSAVNVDSALAVFKIETEQQKMYESYVKLLQDFGKFLINNNFNWEKPTKCFNRIYFNSDGTIDYFLYNFQINNVKPEDQISQEKQAEFDRLLNLFIKDYKIPLTANTKFAECSPVTYRPKKTK